MEEPPAGYSIQLELDEGWTNGRTATRPERPTLGVDHGLRVELVLLVRGQELTGVVRTRFWARVLPPTWQSIREMRSQAEVALGNVAPERESPVYPAHQSGPWGLRP